MLAQFLVPVSGAADSFVGRMTGGPGFLAVYDDGIVRGTPPTLNAAPRSIAKGPPGMVVGADDSALYLLAVSQAGLTQTVFRDLAAGRAGAGIFYADNRVHVGNAVIDVANPAAPRRVGTFAFTGTVAAHSSNRVVMLSPPPYSSGSGQWELRLLEAETFTQRGAVKIPVSVLGVSSNEDRVEDLVYLGGDAVALIARRSPTGPSRVVLLRAFMLANDGVTSGGSDGPSGELGVDAGTADAGGSAPGALCAGCTLQKIAVPGFHMIHDSVRSRLYVVSTYDAAHDPNTLTSIDVATGTVLAKLPIDSSPRQLALSDDGATLWVGFDTTDSIRKFSISSTPPVAGAAYPLPPTTPPNSERTRVHDLVALPGSSTSIAASISGFTSTRVAILDDGVVRPTIDLSRLSISKLTSGPSGTLFGYDGLTSAYTFASYAVSPSGVALLSSQQGLMGVYDNDIHYHQGRVYADRGEVIDVADPARPFRVGLFAFAGQIAAGPGNRMLMLTPDGYSGRLLLRILETTNFTQVTSLSLGSGPRDPARFSNLVYLGGDGVAFLGASEGTKGLFILRSPQIAAAP